MIGYVATPPDHDSKLRVEPGQLGIQSHHLGLYQNPHQTGTGISYGVQIHPYSGRIEPLSSQLDAAYVKIDSLKTELKIYRDKVRRALRNSLTFDEFRDRMDDWK